VAFSVLSIPTFAQHGGAAYDISNPVTLMGTVTDFQFINPHSLVFFDLRNNKGEVEPWQCELTSPNKLAGLTYCAGINRTCSLFAQSASHAMQAAAARCKPSQPGDSQ
jgi:hypothetical protein